MKFWRAEKVKKSLESLPYFYEVKSLYKEQEKYFHLIDSLKFNQQCT